MKFKIICCLVCLFCTSCYSQENTNDNFQPVTTLVDEQVKKVDNSKDNLSKVEDSVNNLKTNNETIKKEADTLITEPLTPSGKKSVENIKNNSEKISLLLNSIQNYIENIKINLVHISEYSKQILEKNKQTNKYIEKLQKLEKENEQLKRDAQSKLYSYLTAIFGISLLTIVAGFVVAFFVDKKLGLTISAIGIMTLAFAAGATFYLKWIAIIGIIVTITGLLFSVGLLIYHLTRGNKQINTLVTANEQTIELVEAIKQELDPETKVTFFGDKALPGIAQAIQDEKTQDLVRNIRETKLKPKINKTI